MVETHVPRCPGGHGAPAAASTARGVGREGSVVHSLPLTALAWAALNSAGAPMAKNPPIRATASQLVRTVCFDMLLSFSTLTVIGRFVVPRAAVSGNPLAAEILPAVTIGPPGG